MRSFRFKREAIHEKTEYIAAWQFKQEFKPESDQDYEWVNEYASKVYERLSDAEQVLDGKAETIIKGLGGGAGLLTIGGIVNLDKFHSATTITLGLALFFALMAVVRAALARAPRPVFLPPSVAWALKFVEAYKKDSEKWFVAQWHLTCEGLRLSVAEKADGVRRATYLAVASLVLVGISFAVQALTMPDQQTVEEKTMANEPQPPTGGGPSASAAPDPSGVPQTPPANVSNPAAEAAPQTIKQSEKAGIHTDTKP